MTLSTRNGTPIGPRHKAAIAVLALSEELAGEILAQFDDKELKALAAAVDELDLVPGEALMAVLEELAKAIAGPVSVARTGGAASTANGTDRISSLSPRASSSPAAVRAMAASWSSSVCGSGSGSPSSTARWSTRIATCSRLIRSGAASVVVTVRPTS